MSLIIRVSQVLMSGALNLTKVSLVVISGKKSFGVSNFQTDFHMCKVGQDLRTLKSKEKGVVNPVNLGF